ncbi:MAG: hypothetical protein ACK57D_01180 [Sphingobacteriales bacterium]|jgi:hypothetical protein
MEKHLQRWLIFQGFWVSESAIHRCLRTHPAYPSLLSVTDTLEKYCGSIVAFQIEEGEIKSLPFPLIAHVKSSGNSFEYIPNSEFFFKKIDKLSGIVITCTEAHEASWDKRIKNWALRVIFSLGVNFTLLALSLIWCLLLCIFYDTLVSSLFIYFNFIGLVFCNILIVAEINYKLGFVAGVCASDDCSQTIVRHDFLKFFGIGIIDLARGYFISTAFFVSLFVLSGQPFEYLNYISLLGWFGLVVAACSFFVMSLGKKWCSYCISIDFVLIFQFLLAMAL